ncbi:hypothetical protein K8I28_12270 [bacterium]|nr:hypothetical protein [bacterium]
MRSVAVRVTLFLALGLILQVGCSKDNDPVSVEPIIQRSDLEGEWQLNRVLVSDQEVPEHLYANMTMFLDADGTGLMQTQAGNDEFIWDIEDDQLYMEEADDNWSGTFDLNDSLLVIDTEIELERDHVDATVEFLKQ